ncbi:sensor histidine kinase [Novosphingobium sp. PY1]|uniref:sensor histidine kinase n=1 Tax=Novosphingobium sp. PY1 TaxID=1882221 RepID=UPI001A8DC712|nr:HWE histidine kinase domain-containing protein [Novosphingobium sp. PY1]GFM30726.1 signal transduction histidine kinase [Novosphingobium sp. PY1]
MTRFDVVRRAILADFTFAQNSSWIAVAVLVPTVLRYLLGPSVNPVPFVTYFPAVMFVAVCLGWRWAAIATLLSAVAVNRLFLTHPWLKQPGFPEIAILGFFCLSCSVMIFIGDTLRRTVREADLLLHERDLLSGELYHRVQNMLSVMGAMIQMGQATEVEEFRADLQGRVQALSKANRLLREGSTQSDTVGQLIQDAVAAFNRDNSISASGPPRTLAANLGYQLIIILHELCTNALKHGALSVPQGRVHISWNGHKAPFRMEWRESNGPQVTPPTRRGLGSKLLSGQRGFSVDVNYESCGVVCFVTLVNDGVS